ncbi:MAG TPA: carotenoid biosynthesis protein [Clostridia bacterium]|nr:carotenoid biosynthesis protein [Clostridia bacterium]
MNRVDLKHVPLKPANPFSGWLPKIHRVIFGIFLLQWTLVWARLWLPYSVFGEARWPEGLLVVLTTATTLTALQRHLPGQNVMGASIAIAVLGGGAHMLGALTAIPFGPFEYTSHVGQRLFGPLPWAIPMIWIVVVLNARGVGRLMLRRWRQAPQYGFWLLGLTVLLVVLMELGLEVFGTHIKAYWSWETTKLPWDWYGTPVVNFLGWAVTTGLILGFIIPMLISKHPTPPPPDYHPLVVWLLLNLLFLTGAALRHLWLAVAIIAIHCVLVTALAIQRKRASTLRQGT